MLSSTKQEMRVEWRTSFTICESIEEQSQTKIDAVLTHVVVVV